MPPVSRLPLLLALVPLLAGCTGGAHHDDGHHASGDGPQPLAVLVGVENQADQDLAVTFTLSDANGTLLWTESFTAPAQGNPERHRALDAPGVYTLQATWNWTVDGTPASGSDRATIDTAECEGLSHLTFVIGPEPGAAADGIHRECHE